MDHQRKPYSKFREVLTQPRNVEKHPSSQERRNAEIKNHWQFDSFNNKLKSDSKQQRVPDTQTHIPQQQSFVLESSLVSSLPRFGTKRQDLVSPQLIINKERQLLEKYKARAKNKGSRTFKSPIIHNIQTNLKGLVDKIGTLTRKIEQIENISSQNLKKSTTFHTNFIKQPQRKKRNFQSYQQFQERQRTKVNSQYDKLRQITRPDFIRTHRRLDTGSHERSTMIKSMLNRQKSEQVFNRAELNRFLNHQRQRKHSNLQPNNSKLTQAEIRSNLLRNMTYKDLDNSDELNE